MVEVGKKGYVILPKAVRELVGIKEGDRLVVKVEDGKVVLEPMVNVDVSVFRRKLAEHWDRISAYVRVKPRLGDLAAISLEEEFEG